MESRGTLQIDYGFRLLVGWWLSLTSDTRVFGLLQVIKIGVLKSLECVGFAKAYECRKT